VAREIVYLRRLRDKSLGDIFGEPAWDMLLDLFIANDRGQEVSISSLCHAAAAPATTALRWINVLEERGLIVRQRDPNDGRRVWLMLTPETLEKMQMLMAARAGKP
jgi:DNA-binding MarR family transcriptional regulator